MGRGDSRRLSFYLGLTVPSALSNNKIRDYEYTAAAKDVCKPQVRSVSRAVNRASSRSPRLKHCSRAPFCAPVMWSVAAMSEQKMTRASQTRQPEPLFTIMTI